MTKQQLWRGQHEAGAGPGAPRVYADLVTECVLVFKVKWWPKPVIVPGMHSWVSDMITLAGGTNPWAQRDCKSTPLIDEEVMAAAPDAIVLSWCGVKPEKVRPDVVQKRVAWRHVPAVAKGHIYCVPEAWMGRPGPRPLEGLRAIRAIVTQVTV